MKTLAHGIKLIEQRARNKERISRAYQRMDQLCKKAPQGWNSARVIRQMRETNH